MKPNVGNIDRVVRILLGVGLLAFFFVGQGAAHWLGLVGLVPLATAIFRWCPAYAITGIDTAKAEVKS